MQYSCDRGNTWTDIAFGDPGTCDVNGLLSRNNLLFRIQADGVTAGFVRSYSWSDYQ